MPSTYAAHSQLLHPTAPSHAVACHLTASAEASTSRSSSHRGDLVSHLVTARDDTLQIWEVRIDTHNPEASASPRLWHLKTTTVFGVITGLQATRTIESESDGRDRLLVSFKDAKLALLEWDTVNCDLATVSIHTYERDAALSGGLPGGFKPQLVLDPDHRCAALVLPRDSLAVLPFTSSADLDLLGEIDDFDDLYESAASRPRYGDPHSNRSVLPYDPSFVLPVAEVDEGIRNVRDVAFLPGFQKPTIAVLCESDAQTWTGSLANTRDTLHIFIFTLDLSSSNHSLLSHIKDLPYDSLYLRPCLGVSGVLLVTASAILHIEQNGKLTGVRTTAWTNRITSNNTILSMPLHASAESGEAAAQLDLSNSSLLWADQLTIPRQSQDTVSQSAKARPGTGLIFLADGRVMSLICSLDGRSVSAIHLEDMTDPQGLTSSLLAGPSIVVALPQDRAPLTFCSVFVGSMFGQSHLASLTAHGSSKDPIQNGSAINGNTNSGGAMDIDYDDDADLYGDSAVSASKGAGDAARSAEAENLAYALDITETMPGLGGITDIALSVIQEGGDDVVKLVAAHGDGIKGGLVFFEDKIQPRDRIQLANTESRTRLWKIGSRTLLFSGVGGSESLVCEVDESDSLHQVGSLAGETLEAAAVSDNLFVRVTETSLELYNANQLSEGPQVSLMTSADVKRATLSAQMAICILENGHLEAFRAITATSDLILQALPVSVSSAGALFASHFTDHLGLLSSLAAQDVSAPTADTQTASRINAATEDDEIDYGDVDEESSSSAGKARSTEATYEALGSAEVLSVVTEDGSVQILSLGTSKLLWRSNSLLDLPCRLDGLGDGQAVYVCSDAEPSSLSAFWIGLIGDDLSIVAVTSDGILAAWTASLADSIEDSNKTQLVFNKVLTKQLSPAKGVPQPPNGEDTALPAVCLMPAMMPGRNDVQSLFVSGTQSGWIVNPQKGAMTFFECSERDVYAFSTFDEPSSIVYSTATAGIWKATLPELDYDLPLARTSYSTGRQYTHVRAFPSARAIAAASQVPTPFVLFDPEDGEMIRDPKVDPDLPMGRRGVIELFRQDWSAPIDGFELEANETVSALELVTLTSTSTPTGLKDFLAVGTTVFNGEDRPTRGSMFIFDIIETVPDPNDPGANLRLKLIVKDDAKGPVTALSDVSGYFVCAVGQKIYVRAFENDEVLIHVAFLDVYYLTTSIRRLGSTLLLGDLRSSVTFIGFREDPFKLTVFGRDPNLAMLNTADFLVMDDSLAFVTTDCSGVVRLLEYNANIASSQNGQRLILRTEYQTAAEYSCSLSRASQDDDDATTTAEVDAGGLALSNEILLGSLNGSISLVKPVKESLFNPLQSLQTHLVRSIPHPAALNPRGYRIVRNETSSRPLNRGILDGQVLSRVAGVARPKREEVQRAIEAEMGSGEGAGGELVGLVRKVVV